MSDERAERYTAERARLVGLAYRMLGSRTDAEDVVQEAWLRYASADVDPDNPAAWLTTVTSRLALDRLRSAPVRREQYVGPWLPEPVRTAFGDGWAEPVTGADPADLVDRAASLTLGFLVVLDTLTPEDRAVFLLADVFAVPFPEVAEIVGRSPDACRQAASRARRRLREAGAIGRPVAPATVQQVAEQLAVAVATGDLEGTLALLSPEVVLVSDGGATRHAARRPVVGADKVARFLVNVAAKRREGTTLEMAEINSGPALITRSPGEAPVVWTLELRADGRIGALRMVLAPEKLAALDADALEW